MFSNADVGQVNGGNYIQAGGSVIQSGGGVIQSGGSVIQSGGDIHFTNLSTPRLNDDPSQYLLQTPRDT